MVFEITKDKGKMKITEILIKRFEGENYFTCLIYKGNNPKPITIKLNSSPHARMVLEQFTKLCSQELGGSIPSEGVTTEEVLKKENSNIVPSKPEIKVDLSEYGYRCPKHRMTLVFLKDKGKYKCCLCSKLYKRNRKNDKSLN